MFVCMYIYKFAESDLLTNDQHIKVFWFFIAFLLLPAPLEAGGRWILLLPSTPLTNCPVQEVEPAVSQLWQQPLAHGTVSYYTEYMK